MRRACSVKYWLGAVCEGDPQDELPCKDVVQNLLLLTGMAGPLQLAGVAGQTPNLESTKTDACNTMCEEAGCDGFTFSGPCDTTAAPLLSAYVVCTRKLDALHARILILVVILVCVQLSCGVC